MEEQFLTLLEALICLHSWHLAQLALVLDTSAERVEQGIRVLCDAGRVEEIFNGERGLYYRYTWKSFIPPQ